MSTQNGCLPTTFLIETENLNTWANSEQPMVVMASDGPSTHSPSLRLGLPVPQTSRRHHTCGKQTPGASIYFSHTRDKFGICSDNQNVEESPTWVCEQLRDFQKEYQCADPTSEFAVKHDFKSEVDAVHTLLASSEVAHRPRLNSLLHFGI